MPTTANYILVATIMAPVIVELGAQSGLVIPLIAVHLFVFYFGIMADVTPPVGLASYAAAAISGDDPNATGWQATWYSFRTAVLPFVFVFNPQILFIGVHSWWEVTLVAVTATVASLLFAAATMAWFRTRCNVLEIALLLLATFLFFRPDWVIDHIQPEYVAAPAEGDLPRRRRAWRPTSSWCWAIKAENIEGEEIRKVVALPMGPGRDGRERIRNAGVTLVPQGEDIQVADVKFGSLARKLGLDQGATIAELKLPNPARPSAVLGLHPRRAGGARWSGGGRAVVCARLRSPPAPSRRADGHRGSAARVDRGRGRVTSDRARRGGAGPSRRLRSGAVAAPPGGALRPATPCS